jgi:hypothetical protein
MKLLIWRGRGNSYQADAGRRSTPRITKRTPIEMDVRFRVGIDRDSYQPTAAASMACWRSATTCAAYAIQPS